MSGRLLGSRAWAKELADTGVQVVAMFNADMLGWKLPGTAPTLGMKDRYIADWPVKMCTTVQLPASAARGGGGCLVG